MTQYLFYKIMTKVSLVFLLGFIVFTLTSCVKKDEVKKNDFTPPKVEKQKFEKQYNGAIYQPGMHLNLFNDTQGRHIGDIVTIRLVEAASALSSSDTRAEKKQNVEFPAPKVAGSDVTQDGKKVLENNLNGERDFRGSGESNQAHNFQAVITVSVVDVLPNNYLVVRGEKLIALNQSEEFIRFSGIIRPQDIGPDNSVESKKVANVRISYSGQGVLSHANKMGTLAKFFQSEAYPY